MKVENLFELIYSDLTLEILDENLKCIFIGKVWDIPDELFDKEIRWLDVRSNEEKWLFISIQNKE